MELNLSQKCVLITGGTRGIGLSIVERFLDEGANVAFCARSAASISATEKKLNTCDLKMRGWPVDMTQGEEVESWVEQAADFLGGIDIVIANAGGMGLSDTDEDWRRNYAVEIGGLRHILNIAKPCLEKSAKTHGDAAVIAIASTSAGKPSRVEAYGPVKIALVHYVKALSKQLGALNIRANTISPGPTYVKDGFWGQVERETPKAFKTTRNQFPMKRMVQAQEIADVVAFLASPRAGAIAGSNLIVDGGRSDHIQI